MKKLFALVSGLLLLAAAASAQDLNFGVKGGVAANWMPGTVIDGFDRPLTNVGFYGGVTAALDFSGSFYPQVEVLYARKGVSTNNDLLGRYSRNISYIQVPVLAGFKAVDDRMRLLVGPEFGFCVGEKIKYGNQYDFDPASIGKAAPFNFAIAIQATYFILDGLGFDIKFDYALTRTLKEAKSITGVVDKGRNMSLQLGLCYVFGM